MFTAVSAAAEAASRCRGRPWHRINAQAKRLRCIIDFMCVMTATEPLHNLGSLVTGTRTPSAMDVSPS